MIIISDSSLSTTLGIGTTIASDHNFLDEYSTTVCCLTSSLSSTPSGDAYYLYLNSTNNYLNSLTNEQIVMLEEKIASKEQDVIRVGEKEFTLEQVGQLTTSQQSENTQQVKVEKPKVYKKI